MQATVSIGFIEYARSLSGPRVRMKYRYKMVEAMGLQSDTARLNPSQYIGLLGLFSLLLLG